MRVSIPIMVDNGLNSEISAHFGQSAFFLIIDLDSNKVNKRIYREEDIDELVLSISAERNLAEHACASLADLLTGLNVEILLVEGIGGRPFQLLKENGVKIFAGAYGSIREILRDFLNGMLQELESASCNHHQHHH